MERSRRSCTKPDRCAVASLAAFAVTLGFTALAASAALGAVIHVPGDYPTIQQAISAASSGDVVMVAEGEYFEHITLKAGVIVQGAGDERSIINGGGGYGDVVSAVGNDITSGAKLIGFTVTGAISGGGMPGGAGLFCNSGGSPDVANCRFRGNDFGIATWNNGNPSIHNNVIVGNNFMGVDISSRPTVVNNTIDSNGTGVYDSGGYRAQVMNNIVTRNSVRGIGATSPSYPPTLSYNDVWGNGQNYYNCSPGTGDISADPLFRNAGEGDYHLSPGSPCINAGNPDGQYNDPDGSRNDMGAYGGPGAESDTPRVSLTDPARNARDVALDTDASAVFTVAMNGSTLNAGTFLIRGQEGGFNPGTVSYDAIGHSVTISPAAPFRTGERVTALLTSGVQSEGGASLAGGYAWQFVCAASDGSAEYALLSAPNVQTLPFHAAAADFNRDGRLDVVCGHRNPVDQLSIQIGQGDGTFAAERTFPAGVDPLDPVAGDFDRDGNMDVATALGQGGGVAVLFGNGDGTFGPPSFYGFATIGSSIATGDVDADGDLDLVVTNTSSAYASILLNDGSGSFAWGWTGPTGPAPTDVKLGDLNGDGILDLMVACSGSVAVRLGVGDGTFGAPRTFTAGVSSIYIDTGDLNGDGVLDIAAADVNGNRASILLGDGLGGFTGPTNYAAPSGPHDIVIGDLDADGDLDLALSSFGSNAIAIFRNRGNGTFDPAVSYPAGTGPEGIVSGDFDGDGDIDLGVTNLNAHTFTSLLNENTLGITSLDPAAMALHVPLTDNLRVVFDAAVDPSTLNGASVRLRGAQSGPHSGAIAYDGGSYTLTFDPGRDFAPGELMSASLTTGIVAGNGVRFTGFTWDFTARATTATRGGLGGRASYTAGQRGIQAADFDGDRDVDIAVCAPGSYPNPGSVAVLMNRGDGTFAPAASYSLGAADPIDLFAADLDGDGDIDLAVLHNEPGSSHLNIMINAGNGTFTRAASYTPVTLGDRISGGDLDADGDIDLVLTDGWGSSNNVKVMYNAGNATFPLSRTYSAGIWANGVALLDADGDGDRDIAIANPGSGDISILYNDGTGAFPRMQNFVAGANVDAVSGNDLNGDGMPDLAAGGSDGAVVLLNQGSGNFGSATAVPIPGTIHSMTWVDIDGDGDLDLAAAVSDASFWVALNDGAGAFGSAANYALDGGPQGIAAADFNGDGANDLAAPIWDTSHVNVYFGIVQASADGVVVNPARGFCAFPNPFSAGTTIAMEAGRAGSGAVAIHDISGRLVRSLRLGTDARGSGLRSVFWDGTDEHGRPVGAGIYFARPLSGGGRSIRIVRVR